MAKENKKEKLEEKMPAGLDKHWLEARTVMIFGDINMELSKKVCSELLALSQASKDPIKVFINSPGGHVEAGDTIYDMIRFIPNDVYIIGTGWVASIAALFYLSAPKKYRFSLPNTRYLLHQPHGGAYGQADDVEIQAKEIIKMRERLTAIISKETGMKYEKVAKDIDRDYWLSAEEAKDYGIVGKIITSIKDLPK